MTTLTRYGILTSLLLELIPFVFLGLFFCHLDKKRILINFGG